MTTYPRSGKLGAGAVTIQAALSWWHPAFVYEGHRRCRMRQAGKHAMCVCRHGDTLLRCRKPGHSGVPYEECLLRSKWRTIPRQHVEL